MNDPVARIPNVAARFPRVPVFLREMIGYEAVQHGDDFVILDNDPHFSKTGKIVCSNNVVDLRSRTRHKLAGLLIRSMPTTMNQFYEEHNLDVKMEFKEFSELPRFYQMAVNLATASPPEVRRVLRDNVLPRMIDEVGAQWACPVVVDSVAQQAHLAAAKMLLLLQKNDLETAYKLATHNKVYEGILPTSLDLSDYVVTLTRFLPFMFTVPARRADCVWHFAAARVLHFEHVRCVSLFDTLCAKGTPLGSPLSLRGIRQLATIEGAAILRYLQICVDAVCNLMSFLNDLRNFAGSDLVVDFGSQLQAYASFHLLFADVASMASSAAGYDRLTKAMAAIDKISNLIKDLGNSGASETYLFKWMFGPGHERLLKSIIRRYVDDPDLAERLCSAIQDAYQGLIKFYSVDMEVSGKSEIALIQERIRVQRNLHHGAYLHGERFHKAFGTSSGRIAEEIVFIAFVSTLCLALAPKMYLLEDCAEG